MAETGFRLLYSVVANEHIPVSKYKSNDTGITVIIAQVEGPIVNGYFCLATEAHDDDGLPHTLEHLIFLGSEDYPYKGVLDLVANRCLASGTNAWTDTDHTCYTLTNAGSDGFITLLPVYLDHILYPTITKSGYITEVHHINGDGEDAGVVYCEMQARENSGESRCYLEMLRTMYPGHCGYKSETGGLMKNLRESTSHAKVEAYHKAFYRPENLCLILTGQINPDEVFAALKPFEKKILSKKNSRPEYVRPWQSPVPPLENTVEKKITFAADEEEHGMVYTSWRGPRSEDQYNFECMNVLLDYLGDTAISPLQRDFVEIEDPYCSVVSTSMIENSECCIKITFKNVKVEKLDKIHSKLVEVLQGIGMKNEGLDMNRMFNIIHRRILNALNNVEDDPHETVASICIGDFLYGGTKEQLEARVNTVAMYKKMKNESDDFWVSFLNKYFMDKPHVVIIGNPSKKLMEDMGNEEKARIEKQKEALGEAGLKEKEEILENANEENEVEPPDDLLMSFSVPDVGKIKFHPITPASNLKPELSNKINEFPLTDIPMKFQLDSIHTNFVQMSALLDSTSIPQNLKYYLPLFTQVLFESPVLRDGVLISHEEIISQLEADTLYTYAGLGFNGRLFSCGECPQIVSVIIKVEQDKYERGVHWLREILYQTRFPADRLKIVAQKLVNDIASGKRSGVTVTKTVMRNLLFSKDCNHYVSSMLKQEKFLKTVLEDINKTPEKVSSMMEELRNYLVSPSNIHIHMFSDVAKLAKTCSPSTPWKQFLQETSNKSLSSAMKRTCEYVLPLESSPEKHVILSVGSVESAFFLQAVPSINSYTDEDLPALMVFTQYLTLCEGPLWKQIRGLGLSYHYAMFVNSEVGMLYFLLARATHVVNAYKEGRDIICAFLSGEEEYTEVDLEAARSSLIFELIEEEKTASSASDESMLSHFRNVGHDYNLQLIRNVNSVTIDDLKRVGPKYVSPLFDSTKTRCAVCCNPSKVEEIKADFEELSVELKVLPSLEEDFLCKL